MKFGMPGMTPMMPSTAAATPSAFGWPNSCLPSSLPTSCSREMRVTMMATATDSSRPGICATRPSPMVSSV